MDERSGDEPPPEETGGGLGESDARPRKPKGTVYAEGLRLHAKKGEDGCLYVDVGIPREFARRLQRGASFVKWADIDGQKCIFHLMTYED